MDAVTLTHNNRQRLREVVRRVHMKHYPTERLNDYEADKIRAALAPESAERFIKAVVDGKLDTSWDTEHAHFKASLLKL